jgi:hypothetical protein
MRGLALAEALAAVALVGIATIAASGLLVRGRAIGRRLSETRVAVEAVATELALLRTGAVPTPFGEHRWTSPPPPLPGACGRVAVDAVEGAQRLRRLRVELQWGVERSVAREVLMEVAP